MQYIIIGCGAAGRTALYQIKKADPDSNIIVISEELDPFYLRPYLGYFLINDKLPEAQRLTDENFQETTDIDFRLGRKALWVNSRENLVGLSDGNSIKYNFLLITTGTRFTSPDPVFSGVQCYTLKSRSDALRLKNASEKARAILVYGGGYQALELTRVFHEKGKTVRWIAPPGQFWPRQLPNVTAEEVKQKLQNLKLDFRINRRIVQILDLEGKRYRITDDQWETFEADLILLAPPAVPEVDFLKNSGIHLDRGVLVNEELRTNIPNIFAAGDCAQVFDLNSGQSVMNFGWKSANKQGFVAGENMTGANSVIISSQDEFVLDLMGKKLLERW